MVLFDANIVLGVKIYFFRGKYNFYFSGLVQNIFLSYLKQPNKTPINNRTKHSQTTENTSICLVIYIGVGEYAYQRKDGVYVIPIGCLKD